MKYSRFVAAVLFILLGLGMTTNGQEMKQETAAGAGVQTTKQETAAPDAKQDMKPEATHDHQKGAAGTEKRIIATVGADGVQRVEIIGGSYYFDPNYIVVKVNIPVELVVKKAPEYTPHDIVAKAPEAGIDFKVDLNDKKPELIKFTPTKIGKYPMYCDKRLLWFESHRERGMEGTIEVVP
jgi:plastocyanin